MVLINATAASILNRILFMSILYLKVCKFIEIPSISNLHASYFKRHPGGPQIRPFEDQLSSFKLKKIDKIVSHSLEIFLQDIIQTANHWIPVKGNICLVGSNLSFPQAGYAIECHYFDLLLKIQLGGVILVSYPADTDKSDGILVAGHVVDDLFAGPGCQHRLAQGLAL